MADVQIGQTLYEAPRRWSSDYTEYTVEKIGRKWITLSRGARCTIDTLRLDCGGYGARQLYLDKETHRQESRLNAAWSDFTRDVRNMHRRPQGITVEVINEIRSQLGLQVLSEKEPTHAA